MRRPMWLTFLVGALLMTAVGIVANEGIQAVIVQTLGWTALVLAARSARRLPRRARWPWYSIALGGALILVSGLVRYAIGVITDTVEPFPTLADPISFAGYAFLIAGTLRFGSLRRHQGASNEGLIDALIMTASIAVVMWAMLLAPYVRDGSVSGADRTINVAYSIFSLLLLAACTRLAVGPGARAPSYYLLAAAVGLFSLNDLLITLQTTGVATSHLTGVLSPPIYALFAASALHPSMVRLTDPPTHDVPRLTWRRLVLLGFALLLAPAVITWSAVRGRPVDLPVMIAGSSVLATLVLARLAGLVRGKERVAAQEQILREGSASLATSTGRQMMNHNALQAVSRLAEGIESVRVSMAIVADHKLEVMDSVGHRADEAIGASTLIGSLPVDMSNRLLRLTAVSLEAVGAIDLPSAVDGTARSLFVAPLGSQNELSGAIIVTSAEPVPRPAQQGIELLASTVSLALESALLTEDLVRQKSERRFRALVENSSDIVLVISGEERISFVSPAAQHLLGYAEAEIIGTRPGRWVHPADRSKVMTVLSVTDPDPLDDTPLEMRLLHADGTFRWFDVRTRDLTDDPEILGVVVNAREISDRKAAEDLLATSEARFRALVQHSSDAVGVVDLDGRFTYVSPAISAILGLLPAELVGTPATDLLSPDELIRLHQSHAPLLDHALPAHSVATPNMEVRLRDREGSWHIVDITVSDLRHEPAIGGIVLNARDITERKTLEHDLRHQSLHDGLTGLANRAMFAERVTETLRIADDRHLIGALFINIDDFKTVNDSLGQAVGDELLAAIAERLLTCLHPADVAARLGGDEFAILVVAPWGESEVVKVAERVLLTLQAPFTIDERAVRISASVGIAVDSDRSSDAEAMLRNAGMAMFLAKERGKSRFELFEERMQASVFERLELKNDLARGIEEGQLRLLFQPVVSLETGRITGVEALVRWEHPVKGMLPPDVFIPLAEETGLILPLGDWVMEEACQQLQSFQLGLPTEATLTMAVNFSAHQLQLDGIVEKVASTINRFGLDPSTITLEITETVLMHDTELTRRRLAELREIGVSLAVDDFGTGYSSLQYVQRFPIDIIKIDQTFVSALGEQAGDLVVVQSMIELAQRLGVHTVAEGIERSEQVHILQGLGADLGQGYYFSRPVTATAISALLDRSLAEGTRFLQQS